MNNISLGETLKAFCPNHYNAILVVIFFPFILLSMPAVAKEISQEKPNIVLISMDNFGWGELGVYGGGILRGAPTPRIDSLAKEGMRLLNFNVEAICNPSRAALMTGRYGKRTGNASFNWSTTIYGLVPWEETIAEILSDVGYSTGMFGKWHLGHTEGRFPTDQGFDEWYGIPNSSDESYWADDPLFDASSHPFARAPYVMEGRKGKAPVPLKVYNQKQRILIDEELTTKVIDFMERKVREEKPFFVYIPYTQQHYPKLPHPDFKGKTGNGDGADVLAQIDHYVGRVLDAIARLKATKNTIVIFTSDNGPERGEGTAGYWRGNYGTELESSLRVPFLMRWPGRVPQNIVSNEIVHQMDLLPTLARIAGAKVPGGRIIDGVDQTDFFTGKQAKSNRESFVIYVAEDIAGVKWRNWKMITKPGSTAPVINNLLVNPKELKTRSNTNNPNYWVRFPMYEVLNKHHESFKRHPAIPPGAPDSYMPNYEPHG